MRIHTNLTYAQMRIVVEGSGAPIYAEVLEKHGSRTHERAFEVRLGGSGGKPAGYSHGSEDWQTATWDEWGAFLGALYDADPEARCGGSVKFPTYRDRDHYHFVTGDRFRPHFDVAGQASYLPIDTHPRHRWEYKDSDGFRCAKCTAYRPTWQQVDAYAPRSYA